MQVGGFCPELGRVGFFHFRAGRVKKSFISSRVKFFKNFIYKCLDIANVLPFSYNCLSQVIRVFSVFRVKSGKKIYYLLTSRVNLNHLGSSKNPIHAYFCHHNEAPKMSASVQPYISWVWLCSLEFLKANKCINWKHVVLYWRWWWDKGIMSDLEKNITIFFFTLCKWSRVSCMQWKTRKTLKIW